jgi:hypothetical protein
MHQLKKIPPERQKINVIQEETFLKEVFEVKIKFQNFKHASTADLDLKQ